MRLVRFGKAGQEMPGVIDAEEQLRDARPWTADWAGAALDPAFLAAIAQHDMQTLPLVVEPQRLGPCVGRIGKIIGVALNYQEHVAETGARPTTEPTLFLKATSGLCGAHDPIVMPPEGRKLDWEVELGLVIGHRACAIDAAIAADFIAGYCLLDDVSERAFQIEHGGQQHSKGKSATTFCPLGPWLVPASQLTTPQNLMLWTEVNGARVQDGTTAQMIYGINELVAYCSRFMTLEPGDVIATGTPSGVGHGMKPPRYLAVGDMVRLGGAGLGTQEHRVVTA